MRRAAAETARKKEQDARAFAQKKARRDALYAGIQRQADTHVTERKPRPSRAVAKPRPAPAPKPAPEPRARPAPADPARVAALLQAATAEISKPTQRKVFLRVKELARTPAFADVKAPTLEEVGAYLADNPRRQAKFPVPEFPGRNQYGARPLEILGADLIEKDKTTKAVPGNKPGGALQTMILVV